MILLQPLGVASVHQTCRYIKVPTFGVSIHITSQTGLRKIDPLTIVFMALELYIPPCIGTPAHALHLPPLDRPLRIQIEGPLVSVQKLVPGSTWHIKAGSTDFPQWGGIMLAKLTYRALYGVDVRSEAAADMIVRHEYLGWVMEGMVPT